MLDVNYLLLPLSPFYVPFAVRPVCPVILCDLSHYSQLAAGQSRALLCASPVTHNALWKRPWPFLCWMKNAKQGAVQYSSSGEATLSFSPGDHLLLALPFCCELSHFPVKTVLMTAHTLQLKRQYPTFLLYFIPSDHL